MNLIPENDDGVRWVPIRGARWRLEFDVDDEPAAVPTLTAPPDPVVAAQQVPGRLRLAQLNLEIAIARFQVKTWWLWI